MTLSDPARPAASGMQALQAALGRAYRHLDSEVQRARTLGGDAIGRLLGSFRGVQLSLLGQHQLLREVTEAILSKEQPGSDFESSAKAMVNEFVQETLRVGRGSMSILEGLARLNQNVSHIVSSTEQIERLARASKMIALNARVETARAGAAGTTFNVVAVEIKRMAVTSTELSAQIRSEVANIRKGVEETTQTAEVLASHDMNVAVQSHKSLMAAITGVERVRKQLDLSLREIEEKVAEAVQALQFEDMLTQTLDGISAKLAHVAEVVHDVVDASAAGELEEQTPELVARLEEAVVQDRVVQSSMVQGTCELF